MAEYSRASGRSQTDAELIQEALDRFRVTAEAEAEQRKLEVEDLRFIDLDEQWPDELKAQRSGFSAIQGQPPLPARPCLTINKLKQPVALTINQERAARLGLEFSPKGNGASREVADVFEDLARAIQADSRANIARSWAFQRAVKCGRGFYRILIDYANDGDDQLDIVYKRIPNQSCVYMDPFAQEPDWSDGEWVFVTEDMPVERFKRLYKGKSALANYGDEELSSIGDQAPGWVQTAGEQGTTIRIAEYWYYEHHDRKVNGRTLDAKKVCWVKLTCQDILDNQDWPGRYIPIIPVIGNELNVNGTRRWDGIVRSAKDAQRSYNYMTSAQVEAIGLAPRAPFMMVEGQQEGYEAMYQLAATRNMPYLLYRPIAYGGQQAPPPQRQVAEPAIQAITMARSEANSDIQATTGSFDPSLGNIDPHNRSGKAVLALQKQSEMSGSGFLDNLAHISMAYEGKVLKDLIPKVYNTPGRIVPTIGADDKRKMVMLNQPFTVQNGQPQPARRSLGGFGPFPTGTKMIDLSQGEYTVAVTVGKSYTTKREEAAAMMGDLLQAMPQATPVIADLLVENLDIPGGKQIADRLHKMLPPQLQDQDEASPEIQAARLQQQNQQMAQMLDLTTKELNAKNQVIETEQVKAQQNLAEKQIDQDTRIKVAWIQAAAQLAATGLKVDAENARSFVDALEQRGAKALDAHMEKVGMAHDVALAAMSHLQQQQQTDAQQAHDAAMQGAQQDHEAAMAQQQQAAQAQQTAEPSASQVE